MRLVQFTDRTGARRVALSDDSDVVKVLDGVDRVRDLALEASGSGRPLAVLAASRVGTVTERWDDLVAEGRVLPPIDHPDPAHCRVTGPGLSHLGSAAARDAMHAKIAGAESALTDSMKMFKWGVEGGKPAPGAIGKPPEWFYKGDARWVVAPEQPLELPAYAEDGGEEVEVAGLYVIDHDGTPLRVGFALANEYSDHVIERQNYLYLAHSKLRQSSFGPELLLGELPRDVRGHARLLRGERVVWEADWLSGEDNMCHSVANLEHHHFRYRDFRHPGDVHVHFFGAATGSFTQQVRAQVGDMFEISAAGFGRPLRNPLGPAREASRLVSVRAI